MATTDALLAACKVGLGIQPTTTAFDGLLVQKITLVKGYMAGAGVSTEVLDSDEATATIVLGVSDSWNLSAGEVKFSPIFTTLVSQLAAASTVLAMVGDPADGSTGVPVDVKPVLTFNRKLASYSASLMLYDTQDAVTSSVTLDVTGKVLTLTPASGLAAGTKYAIAISAVAVDGPSLRAVLQFTTAG